MKKPLASLKFSGDSLFQNHLYYFRNLSISAWRKSLVRLVDDDACKAEPTADWENMTVLILLQHPISHAPSTQKQTDAFRFAHTGMRALCGRLSLLFRIFLCHPAHHGSRPAITDDMLCAYPRMRDILSKVSTENKNSFCNREDNSLRNDRNYQLMFSFSVRSLVRAAA